MDNSQIVLSLTSYTLNYLTMKKLLLSLSLISFSILNAQTTFWSENFGTDPVCQTLAANNASPSVNGVWTMSVIGTNDMFANDWYISAREAGMAVSTCGDGCTNNPTLINRTLHVSLNPALGDVGAAYGAGPGISNTNKRIQSPTINCSGQTGITLQFTYIMFGIVNQDFCQIEYSADNGVNWTSLGIPAQTPTTSCSGQGLWSNYSVSLPASANNNATVKIGFRWQNISSTGADPSFAVDNITLTSSSTSSVVLNPTFTMTNSICQGGSVTVTANTGTTAASGYTWSANPSGPIIATPNASATQITYPNAGTYTITLTAAAGTLVASTTQTILVNPTPVVSAFSNTSVICPGGSAVLTGSGTATYTWQPGNGSGFNFTVNPTSTTIYTVSGTSAAGCVGNKTIAITVIPAPTVAINTTTTTICIGAAATLTASGASSYTWMPGNSNGSTLAITPTVNTTYTATGTSSAGCTNSNTITITVITCSASGLADNSIHSSVFTMYPNPAKDKITLKASASINEKINITIIDALGKVVSVTELNTITSGKEKEIDLSNLSQGVYFVKTSINNKEISINKIIKE